jgi:glucose/arabinose dehydrogenase
MSLTSINRKARIGAVSAASAVGLLAALVNVGVVRAQSTAPMQTAPPGHGCGPDQTGLTLPAGFCATIFADNIGHARQLVVAPNGVVYINTWSGRYYHNDVVPPTGFLVALKDSKGTGVADIQQRFGETLATGGHGGTGIALYDGFLYAESNDRIVRYALAADSLQPRGAAEVIVSGLPLGGDHPMHPFMIDRDGKLYIDVASATNACQSKNRTPKSPGIEPCTELKTRGGIWRYDARKTQQVFSPAERYATGIRNAEGIALDSSGHAIYATQHGRDQLRNNWPELYQPEQEATLPAEEVVSLREGGDYGWPECYFDAGQRKLVLAPEYGGDGGKAIGVCASKLAPVAYFPAHWAPNALLFYTADQFPARYRGGAFIAFHGSWDRAPYAQGGYNVVFQPLSDGKASGPCEIFADGFAGPVVDPEHAKHRPSGLAVGPHGSLYVSDDVHGRIYRIVYVGDGAGAASGPVTPCPNADAPAGPVAVAAALPPEGVHPDAGAAAAQLAVPPGSTREMVLQGERIYRGQEGGAGCTGCHGGDGGGTPLGPTLKAHQWLWSDGGYAGIRSTIQQGVANPKQYRSPMPAMGGAQLSDGQLSAVAAYVWALSHSAP